jgi:hypothetical protein
MLTRQKTNSLKSKSFPTHQLYTSSHLSALTDLDSEPTCFSQASKHAHWRQAMSNELNALAQNATWDLVPLPAHAKSVGCK